MVVPLPAQGISTYPYQASFGTLQQPGPDNSAWKSLCFSGSLEKTTSSQWGFSENPGGEQGALAPAFAANGQMEFMPVFFSPEFFMEKAEGREYVLSLQFLVPDLSLLPSSNSLVVRLQKCDEAGEPFFSVDAFYESTATVYQDGISQSIWVGSLPGGPREGTSAQTFRIKSDSISGDGNYRFAFFVLGNEVAFSNSRIYIPDFRVEVSSGKGTDVAAGQLLSPLSASTPGPQPVRFFVRNLGTAAVDSLTACYQVGQGRVFRQKFSGLGLQAQQTGTLQFDSPANLQEGQHEIRFWIESAGDPSRENDTSAVYALSIGPALPASSAAFNFSSSGQRFGWTAHSDTLEFSPSWQFPSDGNDFAPSASTGMKENAQGHDDYLASPLMVFEKDRIYRVEVDFRAIPGLTGILGQKAFSVWLSSGPGREEVTEGKTLLWDGGVLQHALQRRITFFYRSPQEQEACMVFRSNGAPSDGALQLDGFSVSLADTNAMPLVYDFDPFASSDPLVQALDYMVFVDQDGNAASGTETVSSWQVSGPGLGNGGSEYAASAPGLQGKANDWMVFHPVRLQAGTTYYFSLYARVGQPGSWGQARLEFYLQRDCPRYEPDYESQPGWKAFTEDLKAEYQRVFHAIDVEEDGYYFLSVRNVTEVDEFITAEDALNYTVYVDNVILSSRNLSSVQALEAEVPYEARLGRAVNLGISVKNFSASEIKASDLRYCYRLNQEPAVKERPLGNLPAQALEEFRFTTRASFAGEGPHTVKFWVETQGSSDEVDTITVEVDRLYSRDLPYEDSFAPSSLNDWQFSPAGLDAWFLSQDSAMAFSGKYAMGCRASALQARNYLVSPLLKVVRDTTYRIAFRYKRQTGASAPDSIGLYYAYDRFDLQGFTYSGIGMEAASSSYVQAETYVRFPRSGEVYLALGTRLSPGSPYLYVDDFSITDSVFAHTTRIGLEDLALPEGLSVADTASRGNAEFWVKNTGFLNVDTLRIAYCFDEAAPVEIAAGPVRRNDSLRVSIPVWGLSEGTHRFRAWSCMVQEGERADDTVSGTFSISGLAPLPFSEGFEGVVSGTGAVDANRDGKTWEILRDPAEAYAGNSCLTFRHIDAQAGDVFFTNGFHIPRPGRYHVSFFAKASALKPDKIGLRLMEYGPGGFAGEDSLGMASPALQYERQAYAFSVDQPGDFAIAFDYFSSGVEQEYFIDSVRVDTVPIPLPPTGLAVKAGQFSAGFVCSSPEEAKVLHLYAADGSFSRHYAWTDPDTLQVSGLEPATAYCAKVRALSLIGDSSAWSEEIRFSTLDADPCAVPQGLQVEADTFFAVFSCLSEVQEKVLELHAADGSSVRGFRWEGDQDFKVDGLEAGTWYKARVRAVCGEGDSSQWSAFIEFSTLFPADVLPVVWERGSLSVRPNPFVSVLRVDLPLWAESWQVCGLGGTVLRSARVAVSGSRLEIDLGGLPPGMYLFRAIGRERAETAKIIKK